MKLIDYSKYGKKRTPRSLALLLLWEAVLTGFFLGAALIEAVHSRDLWTWLWPLVMGFVCGVAAFQATLLALHNCPISTDT